MRLESSPPSLATESQPLPYYHAPQDYLAAVRAAYHVERFPAILPIAPSQKEALRVTDLTNNHFKDHAQAIGRSIPLLSLRTLRNYFEQDLGAVTFLPPALSTLMQTHPRLKKQALQALAPANDFFGLATKEQVAITNEFGREWRTFFSLIAKHNFNLLYEDKRGGRHLVAAGRPLAYNSVEVLARALDNNPYLPADKICQAFITDTQIFEPQIAWCNAEAAYKYHVKHPLPHPNGIPWDQLPVEI